MRSTLRRSIRRPVLAAVLAASLPAAGCDAFGPRHDTITIEVEASQGATVRLITSHDFTVAYSYELEREVFQLNESDTTWVAVPYEEDFGITSSGRFYVRVAEAEVPEATVSLRVLLDGDPAYQHSSVLVGEGIQYYYRTR